MVCLGLDQVSRLYINERQSRWQREFRYVQMSVLRARWADLNTTKDVSRAPGNKRTDTFTQHHRTKDWKSDARKKPYNGHEGWRGGKVRLLVGRLRLDTDPFESPGDFMTTSGGGRKYGASYGCVRILGWGSFLFSLMQNVDGCISVGVTIRDSKSSVVYQQELHV